MTGWTRAVRNDDFGWMEILPAIALIAALFFGGDWAGEAASEADADRALRGQAVVLAMTGSHALMDVAYWELEPTADFVPIPEELLAGAPLADADGDYAIEMRVSDIDTDGRLRRIEVRVGYDADEGERTWVGLTTVRQDWAVSQADDQRPRGTTRSPIAS